MKRALGILGALALVGGVGQARIVAPPLADRALGNAAAEARAVDLMEQLRCLVCEGQSIADSDAAMAADMRAMVRERIAAGETPDEVRAWLVERYGREISYRPPLEAGTALLWAAPLLLIAAGLWITRASFRRGRR